MSTSLVQPLSQPASSNPGELTAGGPLIDVSAPALPTVGQLVRPGSVPFVSCWAGAYGRLLLSTHERMLTDGLMTCDRLRHVTRGGGGGGMACGSSNQRSGAHRCQLPRLQWLVDVSMDHLGLSEIS